MKLLGSTKSKMIKNKNGEDISHLEITKVVLVHCNIIKNNYLEKFKSLVYICSK